VIHLDNLGNAGRRGARGGEERRGGDRVEGNGPASRGERKDIEVSERDFFGRHFVADDRRDSMAHLERTDRLSIIGDGVVIRRHHDLDSDGGERANAILERNRRVERGDGVHVKIG